jgi:hypothetical protein
VKPVPQETYQLAGLDPRERGFSRPVDVLAHDRQYRATLRYESARIVTEPAASQEAALQSLIATLHGQGYRQLKTHISFREGRYLGSREFWTEYPDPAPAPRSVLAALRSWLYRGNGST